MSENISENKMMQILDWAYEKSINGVPGLGSAQELGDDYLNNKGDLESQINSLIRWQNTKACTSGFLTGLGGIITMPVTLPANIATVMYVQIRMIAAIAHMTGLDVKQDQVKSLVYVALCGSAVSDIFKDVGIQVGTKLTKAMIQKHVTREMITAINKAVGFRLVTKAGSKGIFNLTKMVPILGGVIGGSLDTVTTNIIGNTARNLFLQIYRDSLASQDI